MAKFTPETAKLAGMKSSRKNVPDKVSNDVKAIIKSAVLNELENIEDVFYTLRVTEPRAYIDALIRLLPYVVSKAPEHEKTETAVWPSSFTFNVIGETEAEAEREIY